MPHFKSAAVAVLLATMASPDAANAFGMAGTQVGSNAFVPQTTRQQARAVDLAYVCRAMTHSNHRVQKSRAMTMFGDTGGGMEELIELTKSDAALSKTVRKSPGLFKVASVASIPVSAALGFVMTPSRRIAAHAVGSIASGVLGAVGKSRLDDATESAAKPAIAQVIIDEGLDSPELGDDILELRHKYGVEEEDFAEMCTDIYKRYLIGMVKNPFAKTSELSELTKLREALHLDNLAVGEAHALAAADFYRTTCLFTPVEDLDDPEHPDRMSLDKFLFLSERAFRQGGETDEAFKYEMSRVTKAFDVDYEEALERVAEVAEPFYARALASTRAKLDTGKVSSDMLLRARTSLGIDEQTATDMHVSTFNDEVKALLGTDGEEPADLAILKFPEGAMDRLDKLRDVLGLSEKDAEYEITLEVTQLFQATALDSMADAIAGLKTPAEAWKEMSVRQGELCLSDESMKTLLASMVMQALGKPLETTMTFAKVNNEAATFDYLLDALDAKDACIAVLKESGWDDFADFDEKFFDPFDKNSACGFLKSDERLKLYRIFLARAVRKSESGKELTPELYEKVQAVQKMLGITDGQASGETRATFGPEMQKVLTMAMTEVMGDDYTPELVTNLKAMIDKAIDDYKLTNNIVREFGAQLYTKAVGMVNQNTPSGIPTEEQVQALTSLRELMQLTQEEVAPAHLDVFGPAYKIGVLEAMGSTGVIRPEFRPALDDLRSRLGVAEEAAKQLFWDAVTERLVPMVENISNEMERTMLTQQQLAQKRGKDVGEDVFKSGRAADGVLGLGAEGNIMSDIMNLVDFYTENDIPEKEEVGTKIVEKKVIEGGEEKVAKEEVPEYEITYPVTALEADAIEPEMAELCYRQFVVGGFTTQGPQGARYEAAKPTFGGILGLTKEKMEEIGSNIGSMVYDNYIGNAMKSKNILDQQDMMFLANIQGKLGLTSEQSEKMLLNSQKKILSEEADSVMSDPSPESIKAFREKCNSMGMELEADVGVSKPRLSRMFEEEISPGLTSGEITAESGEILTEIQESLGLTPEDCEQLLESILDKRSNATIDRIRAELLRGREDNTVDLIKRLIRFAAFVDGDLGLVVPEAVGYQIFNIYESLDLSEEDAETVETNKSLLKTALGLS